MSSRFESLPEHLHRPHVRRFLPGVHPAKAKDAAGKEHDVVLLVLQDPLRLSAQPFVLPLQGSNQQQIQAQVRFAAPPKERGKEARTLALLRRL